MSLYTVLLPEQSFCVDETDATRLLKAIQAKQDLIYVLARIAGDVVRQEVHVDVPPADVLVILKHNDKPQDPYITTWWANGWGINQPRRR
jgi:hypothetical protein